MYLILTHKHNIHFDQIDITTYSTLYMYNSKLSYYIKKSYRNILITKCPKARNKQKSGNNAHMIIAFESLNTIRYEIQTQYSDVMLDLIGLTIQVAGLLIIQSSMLLKSVNII